MSLVPCPTCRRHHRADEAACPFCRSPSALRSALYAGVTAAALGLAGCQASEPEPDRGPAAVYGGAPPTARETPPDDPAAPMYGAPPEPPPTTPPPDDAPRAMYGAPPPGGG